MKYTTTNITNIIETILKYEICDFAIKYILKEECVKWIDIVFLFRQLNCKLTYELNEIFFQLRNFHGKSTHV